MQTQRIAGKPLELYKPQHKDEIGLSVMVKNYINWIISSQAPNRGRFNDYPFVNEIFTIGVGLNILLSG